MANLYHYGTTADFDDSFPSGTFGDTLYITNGGTCIVNQSPKFCPGTIRILDGVLELNGAGATSPISFTRSNDTTYIGTSGVFKTTLGWHILGTGAGTDSQVIDFTDYFTKSISGGSRVTDLTTWIPGIWVETAYDIPYTGGTGTLPEKWDYVYVDNNRGTCFSPILEVGTAAGDSSQGTIKVQSIGGTINNLDPLCVWKVVDNYGPVFTDSWRGTAGTAVFSPGELSEWINVSGTSPQGGNDWFAGGTARNTLFDKVFQQKQYELQGTFGTAGGHIIPPTGALIKIPNVKMIYCQTMTQRNSGQATRILSGISSNFIWNSAVATGYSAGTIDVNGLVMPNRIFATHDNKYVNGTYIAAPGINIATAENSTYIYKSIAVAPWTNYGGFSAQNSYYDTTGYIRESTGARLYTSFGGPIPLVTNSLYGTSVIENCMLINNPFTSYSSMNLKYSNHLDNCLVRGGVSLATNPYRITLKNLKMAPNYEYGRMIAGYNDLTSLLVQGLEQVYGVPSTCYLLYNLGTLYTDHIYIKACGHMKYPLYYSQMFLNLGRSKDFKMYRTYLRNTATNTLQIYQPQENLEIINSSLSTLNSNMSLPSLRSETSIKGLWYRGDAYSKRFGPLNSRPSHTIFIDYFRGLRDGREEGDLVNLLIGNAPGLPEYTTVVAGTGGFTYQKDVLAKGAIIESEMDYFALGHTSLTGTVSYISTNSDVFDSFGAQSFGFYGTVDVRYQYDTSGEGGTGFNGDWIPAKRGLNNLASLSIDPTIGVKLKVRYISGNSRDASEVRGIAFATTTGTSEMQTLYPIDQVMTTITLENIVAGSTYYIYNVTQDSLITQGVAGSTTVTASVISTSADNGDTLLIRVRNSSGATKYLPFETNAIVVAYATNTYISQVEDTIAT